jgi:hypothetical protein
MCRAFCLDNTGNSIPASRDCLKTQIPLVVWLRHALEHPVATGHLRLFEPVPHGRDNNRSQIPGAEAAAIYQLRASIGRRTGHFYKFHNRSL